MLKVTVHSFWKYCYKCIVCTGKSRPTHSKDKTLLVRIQVHHAPSFAAVAMAVMSVTLGVILAKKGILTAALTHRHIPRTKSGFWDSDHTRKGLRF